MLQIKGIFVCHQTHSESKRYNYAKVFCRKGDVRPRMSAPSTHDPVAQVLRQHDLALGLELDGVGIGRRLDLDEDGACRSRACTEEEKLRNASERSTRHGSARRRVREERQQETPAAPLDSDLDAGSAVRADAASS
jgi:hypothetical protein